MDFRAYHFVSVALLLVTIVGGWGKASLATDYYVDPVVGSDRADGSSGSPWKSIDFALKKGGLKGGDTLFLGKGAYGNLVIKNRKNETAITIVGLPGEEALFTTIQIRGSSNWVLRRLKVRGELRQKDVSRNMRAMVAISHASEKIVLEELDVASSDEDVQEWTPAEWKERAPIGIISRRDSKEVTVRNCRVKNVRYGITLGSSKSLMEYNSIENFTADGMRGNGDHSVIQYNSVRNCYKVDEVHNDGFQAWSIGEDKKVGTGVLVGNVVRGNRIVYAEGERKGLLCPMHGIGMFDGIYKDWIIENNIIVVDNWHGIAIFGADNVKVMHNTVVDPVKGKPGPVWITVGKHKNGTPSVNSYIINNLVHSFGENSPGTVLLGNKMLKTGSRHFVNAKKFDFRLRSGSSAIDGGITEGLAKIRGVKLPPLPEKDIEGTKRPTGTWYDVGAYESK